MTYRAYNVFYRYQVLRYNPQLTANVHETFRGSDSKIAARIFSNPHTSGPYIAQ